MLHLPTLRYYRTPLLYLGCVLPLCLQLSLTGWAAPLWQSPAPPPDADTYQSLVDRYNKLAPRTKQLWQQHRDREAYEGLRELLTLLQQIYPPAKYPDGHPHIVRCYRDLCLITDELGEYEAQYKYCQEGLVMCRQLFPRDKCPDGSPLLASMLANMGNVLVRRCEYASARELLYQAIEEQHLLQRKADSNTRRVVVADLHTFVAAAFEHEGLIHKAVSEVAFALKEAQHLSNGYPYVERCRRIAEYYHLYCRTLRSAGDLTRAKASIEKSIDLRLIVMFVRRSLASRVSLAESLVEASVVARQRCELYQARAYLNKADQEIDALDSNAIEVRTQESQILCQRLWLAETEGDRVRAKEVRAELKTRLDSRLDDPLVRNQLADTAGIALAVGLSYCMSADLPAAKHYLEIARHLFNSAVNSHGRDRTQPNATYVLCCLAKINQDLGNYAQAYDQLVAAFRESQMVFPPGEFPNGNFIVISSMENLATQLWLIGETDVGAFPLPAIA